MLNFLIMHQGQHEIDESFRKSFYDNLQILYLSGGRHIIWSRDIMDKAGDKPTYKEFKVEE